MGNVAKLLLLFVVFVSFRVLPALGLALNDGFDISLDSGSVDALRLEAVSNSRNVHTLYTTTFTTYIRTSTTQGNGPGPVVVDIQPITFGTYVTFKTTTVTLDETYVETTIQTVVTST